MTKSLKEFANQRLDNGSSAFSQQDFIEAHKNKSAQELQAEFMSEVARQKNNGTFDFNKIKSTVDAVMPYLSDNQKEYVNKLIQGIKWRRKLTQN